MTQIKINPINIGAVKSSSQGDLTVGIGSGAGQTSQGDAGVAVGYHAGQTSQGTAAVAVGPGTGQTSQASEAVAVGSGAGSLNQGQFGIAIGQAAGSSGQGQFAIAIGRQAGETNQTANSIVLNASGSTLNAAVAGLFAKPIRSVAGTTPIAMAYDTTNNEIIAWTSAPPVPTTTTVITTDATPTDLLSTTLATGSVVTITASINAADDAYDDATGGTIVVTARNEAGTAVLVGSPYVIINASTTATFSAVVSGAALKIQVTGIAATNYNWFLTATVQTN